MADRTGQAWAADEYDASFDFVPRHGLGVVDLLDPQPGERVLDLGCGTGQLTAVIAQRGAEVIGIDADAEMVEAAQRQHPQLRIEQADARAFTLDETVDAVFSNAALHWIPEQGRVLERVAAALRPGGRFVAELGASGNVRAIERALRAAAADAGLPLARQPRPWFFPTNEEYTALLEELGFSVEYIEDFDRPTPLEGGESGLRQWVQMFANWLLETLPVGADDPFLDTIERLAAPELQQTDGSWTADYRRLRFVARRRAS